MIIGGAVLYPRMWHWGMNGPVGAPDYTLVTEKMRTLPQGRFVVMAFMDCMGNGANTAGEIICG